MEEKTIRFGDRMYGVALIAFGGLCALTTDNLFLDVSGAIFATEGLGDLISGEHHYLSSRLINYISRGKININDKGDPYSK